MNGNHAALLPLPESDPASFRPPDAAAELGIAVAAAATGLCKAVEEHGGGRLSQLVRKANGERIARVVELQMAAFDEEKFKVDAHREGARHLRKILEGDPDFRHDVNSVAGTLSAIIAEVFIITDRVVALERELAAN